MKLLIILTLLSIILIFIVICKAFYFSKFNGQKLYNKIIWESNINEYNPSISNNVIAIRNTNWEKNSILFFITNLFINHYEDIIIYKNNIRKKLNLSLYDPRIFYNNNYYYIIAIEPRKDELIPNLIKLDTNLDIISVNQFDISEFKKPVKQKNWNFFKDKKNNILVITDAYPKLIIRRVDLNNVKLLDKIVHNTTNFFPNNYKNMNIRCSTNFIPWANNQLICILHFKKNYFYYRSIFFVIEDTYPYRPIKYSKIYHFFNERIEFVSGIQWKNDKILVSLGVNDYKGYVTEVDPNDIEFD
jgi:hypothetical protein